MKRALAIAVALAASGAAVGGGAIEEISVIAQRPSRATLEVTPVARMDAAEAQALNFHSAEDILTQAPNLVVRKRYVGDPNGTLGMRGANMFQTARSLVYADGLPLHYLLQTSYSGSPRWSLVSADELAAAEVHYGPFSAEFSGNAMGGVVLMHTREPEGRRFMVSGTHFAQPHEGPAGAESLTGDKLLISLEDRHGALSWHGHYQRLDNLGQPQTRFHAPLIEPAGAPVNGAAPRRDELGQPGD